MPSACRWGILGTANIARKNWKAIRFATNATLVAVASRDTARAQQFIDECQSDVPFHTAPVACGSYEALIARPDIDAVYVPLPTGIRREWVVKAAEASKHILCEKPCGVTATDLHFMLDACKSHKVQFMDGVMFMHSKRLPLLREVLNDGESVGTVRRIVSNFSFAAGDDFLKSNIRMNTALEPLGVLGDLGWYNIRFSLWAMRYAMPERVSGRLIAEHGSAGAGVPFEFAGELCFPGGATASFYCSFLTELQQWAHISGTKGSVTVPDFVLPFHGPEVAFEANRPSYRVQGCTFSMDSHPRRFAVHEYSEGVAGAQEVNMIQTFSDLVTSKKLDPTWSEVALQTQLVMDACLKSARSGGELVPVGV